MNWITFKSAHLREVSDKAEKLSHAGYLSNICRVAGKGGFRILTGLSRLMSVISLILAGRAWPECGKV